MFDTGYRMLGAGAQGWSREMIWGGRWEGSSGLGTHVHLWWIHVNVWQNQYSIVKKNKVKTKFFLKKERKWTERKWKWSRSVMSDSLQPCRLQAYKVLSSMGLSRQEYWSGFPFPSLGDLPDPGIEPKSPACRQILYHLNYREVPYTSTQTSSINNS